MKKKRRGRKAERLPTSPDRDAPTGADLRDQAEGAASGEPPRLDPLWRRLAREPIAWGLALIILLRPWIDGITHPLYNAYFLWVIVFLFALWAAGLLTGRATVRFEKAALLLAGFLVVAAVTALDTVQKDATYRALLLWVGYGFVFMLAANGLRTRTAIGIVVSAFVVVSLAEAAVALAHYRYVLPATRLQVKTDPSLLRSHFGADVLTPELAHRLNVNRAFGTMLFPNALAAFLILGIPYLAAETRYAYPALSQALRTWRRQRASAGKGASRQVPADKRVTRATLAGLTGSTQLFVSTLVGGVSACLVFGVLNELVLPSVAQYSYLHNETWHAHWITSALCRYVAPLGVGVFTWWVTWYYSLQVLGLVLRAFFAPLVLILELVCLWLTYSRGGFLALAAALAAAGALMWFGRRRSAQARAPATRAVLAGTVLVIFCLVPALHAHGQSAPGPGAAQMKSPARDASPQRKARRKASRARRGVRIRPKGIDLTAKDLMSPNSLWLRLSYWRTGLRVTRGHFWTGVGLGNFGTVYPRYQYQGAGDVKHAHNDYLQIFCETGIFGFLFFVAFWVYFLVWGGRCILREHRSGERWLLAGLYGGVLAFLLHQLVDFGFVNPSLATYEYLLAGVFFARVGVEGTNAGTSTGDGGRGDKAKASMVHQVAAVPLLALAALVAGASVRTHTADVLVGRAPDANKRFSAAAFFLSQVDPATYLPGQPPTHDANAVIALITDQALLKSCGSFMAKQSKGRVGEKVFVVRDPERAQQEARKAVDERIEVLKAADRRYGQNPQVALSLFQWYELLQGSARDLEEKQRYVVQCLEWAEKAVERSPQQAWYRQPLAKALWYRGNIEQGGRRLWYLQRGLEEFRQTTVLYPISPLMWDVYGSALMEYGRALKKGGDPAGGEAKLAEGRKALKTARELRRGNRPRKRARKRAA